ncbi:unnamed protein product [Dibothriocephalus latus]|uniref:Hexosyltransferase n=1 Tax=Dibothriocephalus latus TaxID=60516 RepID=A0A3P6R4Q0_DIBLA|nr:unnamed protein product [Dibothriocephalus latus]
MMTSFQWSARFCRTERPGFLLIHDDYGIHPANLRRFLARLEAGWRERKVVAKLTIITRGHSPSVTCPGTVCAFYFLGYEQVEKLAIAMHFTRPIPVDDVWLGLRFQYRRRIRLLNTANAIRKRNITMPMSAM